MKVEKISENRYRARKTINKKTYRIIFDHDPSDRELILAFAEVLEENNQGENGSFEKCAREYIDNRAGVLSPSSIRTYEIKLSQTSDWFKSLKVFEIENEDVQKEISDFAKDHAPKTTKTLYGFISSVMASKRPSMKLRVKLPQAIQNDGYQPSDEDIKNILDDVSNTRYYCAFQLAILGMRRGEICAADISDLDGNKLHIHRTLAHDGTSWSIKESPKTDASNRTILLPDALADAIRDQGFIFDGHPNALNKAIHRSQKRLGLPSFKFHTLRSYFASYCHAMNIPDLYIMQMGGWASTSTLKKVYQKTLEKSTQEYMTDVTKNILGIKN